MVGSGGGEEVYIKFVSIARFSDLLPVAEYHVAKETHENDPAAQSGACEDRVDRIMRSGRPKESIRLTILDKELGSMHYDSDKHYVYLVITQKDYPQRTAFKFLSEVKHQFRAEFAEEGLTVQPLQLTEKCRPFLMALVSEFNAVGNLDNIAKVRSQAEEVKTAAQKNIQAGLQNQEKLDVLLTQSETLREGGTNFQKTAGDVKKQFWWQNVRLMVGIAILIILIILTVVLSIVMT